MGIISSIGKGVSNVYKTVDKSVGGILPGGVPSSSSSSSASQSATLSTGTSSAFPGSSSYNTSTGTYTSSSGQQQSRAPSTVPAGTPTTSGGFVAGGGVVVSGGGGGGGSSGGGGGGSSGGGGGGSSGGGGGGNSNQMQSTIVVPSQSVTATLSTNQVASRDVPVNVPQVQTLQQTRQNLNIINQANINRNDTLTDYRQMGVAGVILPAERKSTFQKIKEAFMPKSRRTVGQSFATPQELKEAGFEGYTVGGVKLAPGTGGRGTIMTPGPEATYTKTDIRNIQIERANAPIKEIEKNVEKEVTQRIDQRAESLTNFWQGEVDKGNVNVDTANARLKTDVENVYKEANVAYQERLASDPNYNQAIQNRAQVIQKLGGEVQSSGRIEYPELSKTVREKQIETAKASGETALTFTPLVPFVAAKTIANAPTYVSVEGGRIREQLTPIDLNKGIMQGVLGSGTGQTILGVGMLLPVASGELKNTVRSLNTESALSKLNAEIATRQFTKQELETGILKYTVVDYLTGKPIVQTLEIQPQRLTAIVAQQKANAERALFNLNPPATGYVKVGAEMKATIQSKVLNDMLRNPKLSINKDIQNIIESSEIGVYNIPKPFGRKETGVIFTKVVETEQGPKLIGLAYKQTKAGDFIKPRVISGDKKFTEILRKAYPSELAESIKLPVPSNINPLEVYPTDQLKTIKVLARSKGQFSAEAKDLGNYELRKITKESTIAKVGGVQKGTLSQEQLVNIEKIPRDLKVKRPVPIAETKAIRYELAEKAEKDILLNTGVEGLDVNIGKYSTAKTFEFGKIKPIKAPVEMDITKIANDKSVNFADMLQSPISKETRNIIERTAEKLPKVSKPSIVKEPATPTYVGGEGGIDASSMYEFNKDFSKVPTTEELIGISSDDVIAGFQDKVKLPKIKAIKTIIEPESFKVKTIPTYVESESIGYNTGMMGAKEFDRLMNKPKVIQNVLQPMASAETQGFGLGEANIQALTQSQIQKLVQPQVNIPNLRDITTYNPGNLKPIDFGGFGGGSFGNGGGGNKELKRLLKTKGKKRKPKYTSSIGAAALQSTPFKVTKKQLQALDVQTYTGLEARPVLELIPDDKEIRKNIKKVKF